MPLFCTEVTATAWARTRANIDGAAGDGNIACIDVRATDLHELHWLAEVQYKSFEKLAVSYRASSDLKVTSLKPRLMRLDILIG